MRPRVTFVLLDDPISPSLEDLQTGNEQERRPVFLALQADATTLKQDAIDVAAAVGGLLISAVTTLGFALSTYLLADGGRFLDALEKGNTAPLDAASPIAAGIGAVFVAHELAHFGAAAKNGLQTGCGGEAISLTEFDSELDKLITMSHFKNHRSEMARSVHLSGANNS